MPVDIKKLPSLVNATLYTGHLCPSNFISSLCSLIFHNLIELSLQPNISNLLLPVIDIAYEFPSIFLITLL